MIHESLLKTDLSIDQIKKNSDLYRLYEQEGAVCVLSVRQSEETLQGAWALIKVPSIDGTELWFVPETEQEPIEKKIGFQKKSKPLLILSKEDFACIRS